MAPVMTVGSLFTPDHDKVIIRSVLHQLLAGPCPAYLVGASLDPAASLGDKSYNW